jgi:hypothetical protein
MGLSWVQSHFAGKNSLLVAVKFVYKEVQNSY